MRVQNTARNDVAPLNERLTVVVISHNRNAYLRRTLQYYSSYPCTILVLDSSLKSDENITRDYPMVDYRHLPQFTYTGLQEKLAYGVNQVTTPYMVLAADDDFLIHDAVTESLEFLEDNAD